MIRWFLVVLGAFVLVGAWLPGVQITHGHGVKRRRRPIRRGERIVATVLGLLWIWFFLTFRSH